MNIARKKLCLPGNFKAYFVFFLTCNGIVYSQNFQAGDSLNAKFSLSSDSTQDTISNQKVSDNFYRSDSIFSFHSRKGYFPSLLHNFGEQATDPLHFKTKQWLITGAAIGITGALILADNDIDRWAFVQKQKHPWINKSSPVITELGGGFGMLSVIAFGSVSAVFKYKDGVQTGLLATQALITSGAWVYLMKLITGRERPMENDYGSKTEAGKWHGPFAQYHQGMGYKKPVSYFDAFPSGHTATAFSIATVFASRYNDTKVIPIVCYSLATIVGVSRLTEHEHWASDVFAGAIIGYLCGRQVVKNFDKTHYYNSYAGIANSKNRAQLSFALYNNQIGLSLKW